MPRRNFSVVVPDNPDKLLTLAELILKKYYQDNTAARLPSAWMDQLQQLVNTARFENNRTKELERRREKLNEERNLILGSDSRQSSYTTGTVKYFIIAARDILLAHYRGNERALGDWGYTVNSPKGAVQVIIPRGSEQIIALAKLILQKHYSDGPNSLLQSLNWDLLNTRLSEAEQKAQEAQAVNREKEKATQLRNIALGLDKGQNTKTTNTIKYIVRAVRDLLLGMYRGSEQMLGDWGFEVNFSAGGDGAATDQTTPTE